MPADDNSITVEKFSQLRDEFAKTDVSKDIARWENKEVNGSYLHDKYNCSKSSPCRNDMSKPVGLSNDKGDENPIFITSRDVLKRLEPINDIFDIIVNDKTGLIEKDKTSAAMSYAHLLLVPVHRKYNVITFTQKDLDFVDSILKDVYEKYKSNVAKIVSTFVFRTVNWRNVTNEKRGGNNDSNSEFLEQLDKIGADGNMIDNVTIPTSEPAPARVSASESTSARVSASEPAPARVSASESTSARVSASEPAPARVSASEPEPEPAPARVSASIVSYPEVRKTAIDNINIYFDLDVNKFTKNEKITAFFSQCMNKTSENDIMQLIDENTELKKALQELRPEVYFHVHPYHSIGQLHIQWIIPDLATNAFSQNVSHMIHIDTLREYMTSLNSNNQQLPTKPFGAVVLMSILPDHSKKISVLKISIIVLLSLFLIFILTDLFKNNVKNSFLTKYHPMRTSFINYFSGPSGPTLIDEYKYY